MDHIMSSAAPDCAPAEAPLLTHDGLLYRTEADYLAGVLTFLAAAFAADEPAFVAVPEANLDLLESSLDASSGPVELVDITRIGRNPARLMPLMHRFVDAHPGRRVRFVGEPLWPGRSAAEICEATRHEAMLNTAFADVAIDILCPYDARALEAAAVADVWRTHPSVVDHNERRASPAYTDPHRLYAGEHALVPEPPADVSAIPVRADDLAAVRAFVQRMAAGYGLGPRRIQDLVLAVNEIATNTILHTAGSGTLRIWSEPDTVVCEIRDGGYIVDAFAGRRPPNDASDHGRGLWMANELCDLVQLRSTERGTTIRVHIDR
jgi:anti-sigma regulatory factor (Ser/Thr protein kinase)